MPCRMCHNCNPEGNAPPSPPLPAHTPSTPHLHPQICFSIPTSMCCSCICTAVLVVVSINFLFTYFSLEPVIDSKCSFTFFIIPLSLSVPPHYLTLQFRVTYLLQISLFKFQPTAVFTHCSISICFLALHYIYVSCSRSFSQLIRYFWQPNFNFISLATIPEAPTSPCSVETWAQPGAPNITRHTQFSILCNISSSDLVQHSTDAPISTTANTTLFQYTFPIIILLQDLCITECDFCHFSCLLDLLFLMSPEASWHRQE